MSATETIDLDFEKGNFHYDTEYDYDAGTGLSEATIDYISGVKEEDSWVRDFRIKGLRTFTDKPMPTHWATRDLDNIDFNKIRYSFKGQTPSRTWEEVPEDVKTHLSGSVSPSRSVSFSLVLRPSLIARQLILE